MVVLVNWRSSSEGTLLRRCGKEGDDGKRRSRHRISRHAVHTDTPSTPSTPSGKVRYAVVAVTL